MSNIENIARPSRLRRTAALAAATTLASVLAGAAGWMAGAGAPAAGAPVTAGPGEITVAFGGDIHFERKIGARLAADPTTALGPYATNVLSSADLAVVNLETAVTAGGVAESKEYLFRAPAQAFPALQAAGVDVATMANNHALDYGRTGLADTLQAARDASFPVVGLGLDDAHAYRPYRVTIKGKRIAVLGATSVMDEPMLAGWMAGPGRPGVASGLDMPRLTRAVRAAARSADIVILYLHWGEERTSCPTAAQQQLTEAVIGAGADVIVGAHAHRLQGSGWHHRGAYVDYGLGNFVFYAEGKRESTESGILILTLSTDTAPGGSVTKSDWAPARIRGGIPAVPSARDGAHITARKEAARECAHLLDRPGSPAG